MILGQEFEEFCVGAIGDRVASLSPAVAPSHTTPPPGGGEAQAASPPPPTRTARGLAKGGDDPEACGGAGFPEFPVEEGPNAKRLRGV